ncbi:DNA-directed RNA polymerase III subunit RPC7-like [Neodiprion virginianus]|uniref:DNA-directed RNA polymerase III subunit RPC7-like n=1 Tax=Neodiprion virginianus TaxID=2961670 RepID=UPI001EE6BB7C|nr:DNA-directed RNA polymerase III subunit RPC7-like [Neodiprion virginianus]
MANRGRGRGKVSMSINVEQLGFGRGEALPGPVLQPPPKYPPLDYKPTPFTITDQDNYMLEIKRDYAEFLRDTASYVQPIVVNKDIERYSDWFQDMMNDQTSYEEQYDWTVMPGELKPRNSSHKRRQDSIVKEPAKKKRDIDVEVRLKELERKESSQRSDVDDNGKEGDGDNEDDEKELEERPEEEEEELDEEMDDGTDYVNSYFDNGEAFDDEDDNLDDGPVY